MNIKYSKILGLSLLFFVTLEAAFNVLSSSFRILSKNFRVFVKTWQKILILVMSPLLAAVIVIINYFSLNKEENKQEFYGGIFDAKKTYLQRRLLGNSDKTLCFVHSESYSFYYGLILFYAVSMGLVLITYLSSLHKFALTEASSDNMKITEQKQTLIKSFLLFFTIGACWLFLILVMVFQEVVFVQPSCFSLLFQAVSQWY